jgi:hypothetical protein
VILKIVNEVDPSQEVCTKIERYHIDKIDYTAEYSRFPLEQSRYAIVN